MANGLGGNMFAGFGAKQQGLSNAIGQGINLYAQQAQKQKEQEQAEQRQVRALAYLTKASELAGSDPAQSEQAFLLAMKEEPEFVTQILDARNLRNGGVVSASQREFESMVSDLSPEEQDKARRIRLGLSPRAVGSSAMTISDTGATERVAESESVIAESKSKASETGKAKAMSETADIVAKAKSDIANAVKKAEVEGKSLGEAQVAYNQAEAALPNLETVVGKLKDLAPVATSTYSGRAFDVIAKEAGFGATRGAEARAKFIAIVNNQVLPLLKQTFGAAFTVSEAESLKATMGDPNASPAEKMAQLDAFIESKYRELRVKAAEAGQQPKLSESALKYLGN